VFFVIKISPRILGLVYKDGLSRNIHCSADLASYDMFGDEGEVVMAKAG